MKTRNLLSADSQLAHTARKQSTSLVNKIANRPKKVIIKRSSDRAEEEPNKQESKQDLNHCQKDKYCTDQNKHELHNIK